MSAAASDWLLDRFEEIPRLRAERVRLTLQINGRWCADPALADRLRAERAAIDARLEELRTASVPPAYDEEGP